MKKPGMIPVKLSLALLVAVACVTATWLLPGDYTHDLAALVNKQDLLLSAPAPRLIFIGGSNLTTLRSADIERRVRRETGTRYTVVNMGLWGGLSMERYLDELRPFLLPGDVVIVCQEYATLLDAHYFAYIRTNDEARKYFFLMSRERHPAAYLSPRAAGKALSAIIELNQMKLKTYLHVLIDANFLHRFTGGYYRYAKEYTRRGDRVHPFKIMRPLISAGARFQEPDRENVSYLGKFNDYARSITARVVIAYPPFPEDEYRINSKQLAMLAAIYREMGLAIIGNPEDTVFPGDLFADTVYHLTPRGESIRSGKLFSQLCEAIKQNR
jgi:hypothetical protein